MLNSHDAHTQHYSVSYKTDDVGNQNLKGDYFVINSQRKGIKNTGAS